jgi:alpha-amylase
MPCVFYPDLYGARYRDEGEDGNEHNVEMPIIGSLPRLIEARHRFGHGPQTDLFDDPSCIGFIRHGTEQEPGCVVVMSNGEPSTVIADLGQEKAGAIYRDFLGNRDDEIVAAENGKATFPVHGGSVSVWVQAEFTA